jgi:hypothetical protein
MIRDRDRIYGAVVTRRLRAMGIRDKPIAPASPWQSFAERLIGSIRRECLDHILVLGEALLRRILNSYAVITMASELTGLCTRMRRSFARFSWLEPFVYARSSADFITTTSGVEFSVHTPRVMRGHSALCRIKTGRSSHVVGRRSRPRRRRTIPWICDR